MWQKIKKQNNKTETNDYVHKILLLYQFTKYLKKEKYKMKIKQEKIKGKKAFICNIEFGKRFQTSDRQ